MQPIAEQVLDLAIDLQQIPAPTFHEAARADRLQVHFQAAGLSQISRDELGNVYACWPGAGTAAPLVVSAHLDTVFPAGTDLTIRRAGERVYGPGLGDNALGLAGLLGLAWLLQGPGQALPGDVWLVGNVGEEGLGDLRGMRGVVERFGAQPIAYLVLEGMALGQVYHRGLGVQRYRITARTAGGHSWVDYGRPSAIHELARLVTRLTALALPAEPRTTLNVGIIQGGTSVNTIAATASLELDLRSTEPAGLHAVVEQALNLVQAANRPEVQVSAEVIGQRPAGALPGDHPLVRLALEVLAGLDIARRVNIGSTDANLPLSRGLPAICLGLTRGGGAHTLEEYIEKPPLAQGLMQLERVVRGMWTALGR
jgi:acetylornithine deacetylase/succinyl-diaminopimelate desuccinylase-like protein